jgi:glyoxylase-like metal-dependent hydrolase (beta-lactamase superfamily II)
MRRTILGLWLLAGIVLLAQQQRDFSKVEIKVTKVGGPVYMLEGSGGNIAFSAGPDGVFLVDTQFKELAPRIKEAIGKISDKPIRYVIDTHWHGDHVGGNQALGEGATLLADANVRKRMQAGAGRTPPAPEKALPQPIADKMVIHFNGEDIRLIHMAPGHTDGDTVVFFTKSKVIHMGDDMFAGRFPFIDLDSGGNVRGYIAALDEVIKMAPKDAKIIPGHGPLSTVDDLRAYSATLKDCVAIIEKGMKDGKTAEQLKQEKVLAKYEPMGAGFISQDRFIDTLYRGLK